MPAWTSPCRAVLKLPVNLPPSSQPALFLPNWPLPPAGVRGQAAVGASRGQLPAVLRQASTAGRRQGGVAFA